MKKVSEKELRKLLSEYGESKDLSPLPEGTTYKGFIDRREGEGEIYVSPKATTKTKLHEVWHLENPLPSKASPTALVDNEIQAELYALEIQGRPPTIFAGLPAASNLMDTWPNRYNPSRATSLVIGRLRHFGVPEPSWEDREAFIQMLGG